MNPDERLEALLNEHARSYREPDETPRDAMWEHIQKSRRVRPLHTTPRRRQWLQSVAAVAAILILGIAIGRYTAQRDNQGAVNTDVAEVPEHTAPSRDATTPYRIAASEHFGRVELLLAQFQNTSESDDEVFGWARSLLADTRLLLNSPAGLEPEYRELLGDLELVLAQIVSTASRRSQEERRWATDGMEQRSVLQRLRMMRPAGAGT